jgi:glutamine amidotransferase
MSATIGIVNYGMGNLHSVSRQLRSCRATVKIIENPADFKAVQKIVLPGVGHFGKAMENLRSLSLHDALQEAVLVEKKPILGICLGMQLMCKRSEEGESEGLGWFDTEIRRFQFEDTLNYKVPHIGWNTAKFNPAEPLMTGIEAEAAFYFVHSYFAPTDAPDKIIETNYPLPFSAGLARDHIFGVQFHPEKSHGNGMRLLENFIQL